MQIITEYPHFRMVANPEQSPASPTSPPNRSARAHIRLRMPPDTPLLSCLVTAPGACAPLSQGVRRPAFLSRRWLPAVFGSCPRGT